MARAQLAILPVHDGRKSERRIVNLAARPEYQQEIATHYAMLKEWMTATLDFPPERRRRAGYVDRVTGVVGGGQLGRMLALAGYAGGSG